MPKDEWAEAMVALNGVLEALKDIGGTSEDAHKEVDNVFED